VSEREREILALYLEHRVANQRGFYERRRAEYEQANGQSALVTAALVVLGGIAGVLAGTGALGAREVFAVVAAAAPALATALAAYDALYGFESNAKLYRDASRGLAAVGRRAPGDAVEADVLRAWVEEVEGVIGREGSRWGQLTRDAEQQPSPPP